MAVDLMKKSHTIAAHRFFLSGQGQNVHVITDVVQRADGTVWIVSPKMGQRRSALDFIDTVASITMIESANATLVKSARLV